jgi:membrane-bound metal-dependent hydrolase YbcI (DUF457 family)
LLRHAENAVYSSYSLSHPALDFLNVYGVRWLMPFDATWFFGDVLYALTRDAVFGAIQIPLTR